MAAEGTRRLNECCWLLQKRKEGFVLFFRPLNKNNKKPSNVFLTCAKWMFKLSRNWGEEIYASSAVLRVLAVILWETVRVKESSKEEQIPTGAAINVLWEHGTLPLLFLHTYAEPLKTPGISIILQAKRSIQEKIHRQGGITLFYWEDAFWVSGSIPVSEAKQTLPLQRIIKLLESTFTSVRVHMFALRGSEFDWDLNVNVYIRLIAIYWEAKQLKEHVEEKMHLARDIVKIEISDWPT